MNNNVKSNAAHILQWHTHVKAMSIARTTPCKRKTTLNTTKFCSHQLAINFHSLRTHLHQTWQLRRHFYQTHCRLCSIHHVSTVHQQVTFKPPTSIVCITCQLSVLNPVPSPIILAQLTDCQQ